MSDRRLLRFILTCLALLALVGVGVKAGGAVTRLIDPRSRMRAREAAICRDQLRSLAAAQDLWVANQRGRRPRAVTWADLVALRGFLPARPACPAGGIYSLDRPGANPTYSL